MRERCQRANVVVSNVFARVMLNGKSEGADIRPTPLEAWGLLTTGLAPSKGTWTRIRAEMNASEKRFEVFQCLNK